MRSPGYVDAHVHLREASALADIRNAGVQAVRDAGDHAGRGLALRAQGSRDGLRILSAGRALVKAGGYGGRLGTPVQSQAEIDRATEALGADGVDILKIVATGVVSLDPAGTVTAGGFDRDELRAIVGRAARNGLSVMCHVNGEEAIKNAVAAGVRSVEHGFFMTEDALAAMKDAGIFWVPTIGALHRAAAGADSAVQRRITEVIDGQLEMLAKAYTLGVPLAVGTDCVLPDRRYGSLYQDELRWFRTAGIPYDEVERIACISGRELLGAD